MRYMILVKAGLLVDASGLQASADCHIEVRRLFELEDFEPLEAVKRFKNIPGNGRPAGT